VPSFSRPSKARCNRVFFCASGRSEASNRAKGRNEIALSANRACNPGKRGGVPTSCRPPTAPEFLTVSLLLSYHILADSLQLSCSGEAFFIPCLQTFGASKDGSKMLSSGDARDGASVAERNPSPSSIACHEGVPPSMEVL
jgi:hypothetical protein